MTEKKPEARINIEELYDLTFNKKYLDFNQNSDNLNSSSKLISFESSWSDYSNSFGIKTSGFNSPNQEQINNYNSFKSLFKQNSSKNIPTMATDKQYNSVSSQLKNQNIISTTIQDNNDNDKPKISENLKLIDESPVELLMTSLLNQETKFILDINLKFTALVN